MECRWPLQEVFDDDLCERACRCERKVFEYVCVGEEKKGTKDRAQGTGFDVANGF